MVDLEVTASGPRMHVLAVDPGLVTGWALLAHDGTVLESGNLLAVDLVEGRALRDLVDSWHGRYNVTDVIIERMPPGVAGPGSRRLEEVRHAIRAALVLWQVRYVQPSVWKTSRAALTAPRLDRWDGATTTPHQRDAVGIARWWLAKLKEGTW